MRIIRLLFFLCFLTSSISAVVYTGDKFDRNGWAAIPRIAKRFRLSFSGRAPTDMHVGIKTTTGEYYELIIGGWNNNHSAVRYYNSSNRKLRTLQIYNRDGKKVASNDGGNFSKNNIKMPSTSRNIRYFVDVDRSKITLKYLDGSTEKTLFSINDSLNKNYDYRSYSFRSYGGAAVRIESVNITYPEAAEGRAIITNFEKEAQDKINAIAGLTKKPLSSAAYVFNSTRIADLKKQLKDDYALPESEIKRVTNATSLVLNAYEKKIESFALIIRVEKITKDAANIVKKMPSMKAESIFANFQLIPGHIETLISDLQKNGSPNVLLDRVAAARDTVTTAFEQRVIALRSSLILQAQQSSQRVVQVLMKIYAAQSPPPNAAEMITNMPKVDDVLVYIDSTEYEAEKSRLLALMTKLGIPEKIVVFSGQTSSFRYNAKKYKERFASIAAHSFTQLHDAAQEVLDLVRAQYIPSAVDNISFESIGKAALLKETKDIYAASKRSLEEIVNLETVIKSVKQRQKDLIVKSDELLSKTESQALTLNFNTLKGKSLEELTALTDETIKTTLAFNATKKAFSDIKRPTADLDQMLSTIKQNIKQLLGLRTKIKVLWDPFNAAMTERVAQVKIAKTHTEMPSIRAKTEFASLFDAYDELAKVIKAVPAQRLEDGKRINDLINLVNSQIVRWGIEGEQLLAKVTAQADAIKKNAPGALTTQDLPTPIAQTAVDAVVTAVNRTERDKYRNLGPQAVILKAETDTLLASLREGFVEKAIAARNSIVTQVEKILPTIPDMNQASVNAIVITGVDAALEQQDATYDDFTQRASQRKVITDAIASIEAARTTQYNELKTRADNTLTALEALEKRGDDLSAAMDEKKQADLNAYTTAYVAQYLQKAAVTQLITNAKLSAATAAQYRERITQANEEIMMAKSEQIAVLKQIRETLATKLSELRSRAEKYSEPLKTGFLAVLEALTDEQIAAAIQTSLVTQVAQYNLLSTQEHAAADTATTVVIAEIRTMINARIKEVKKLHGSAGSEIASMQQRAEKYISEYISGASKTTLDAISRETIETVLHVEDVRSTLAESFLPKSILTQYTNTINGLIEQVAQAHRGEYIELDATANSSFTALKTAFTNAKEWLAGITIEKAKQESTSPLNLVKTFNRTPFESAYKQAKSNYKKANKDTTQLSELDTELTRLYARQAKLLAAQVILNSMMAQGDEIIKLAQTEESSEELDALFAIDPKRAELAISKHYHTFTTLAKQCRNIIEQGTIDISSDLEISAIDSEVSRVRTILSNLRTVLAADEALRDAMKKALALLQDITAETTSRIAALATHKTNKTLTATLLDAEQKQTDENRAAHAALKQEIEKIKDTTGTSLVNTASIQADHQRMLTALKDGRISLASHALQELYRQRDVLLDKIKESKDLAELATLSSGTDSAKLRTKLTEQAEQTRTTFTAVIAAIPDNEEYKEAKINEVLSLIASEINNTNARLRKESAGFLLIELRNLAGSVIAGINLTQTQEALKAFAQNSEIGVAAFIAIAKTTTADLNDAIAALKQASTQPSPEQLESLNPKNVITISAPVTKALNEQTNFLIKRDAAAQKLEAFKDEVTSFISDTLPGLNDKELTTIRTFDADGTKEVLGSNGLEHRVGEVDAIMNQLMLAIKSQHTAIANKASAAFKKRILSFIEDELPLMTDEQIDQLKPVYTFDIKAILSDFDELLTQVDDLVELRDKAIAHRRALLTEERKEGVTDIASPPTAQLDDELTAATPPALRAIGITFKWSKKEWVIPDQSFKVRFYASATEGFALGIRFTDTQGNHGYYSIRIGDDDNTNSTIQRRGRNTKWILGADKSSNSISVPPQSRADGYTFYQFSIVGTALHLLAYDPHDAEKPYKTIVYAHDDELSSHVASFELIDFHKLATQGSYFDIRALTLTAADRETRRTDGAFGAANGAFVIPDSFTEKPEAPAPAPTTSKAPEPEQPEEPKRTELVAPTPEPEEIIPDLDDIDDLGDIDDVSDLDNLDPTQTETETPNKPEPTEPVAPTQPEVPVPVTPELTIPATPEPEEAIPDLGDIDDLGDVSDLDELDGLDPVPAEPKEPEPTETETPDKPEPTEPVAPTQPEVPVPVTPGPEIPATPEPEETIPELDDLGDIENVDELGDLEPAPTKPVEPEATTPAPVKSIAQWRYLKQVTIEGKSGKQLIVQPEGDVPIVIELKDKDGNTQLLTIAIDGLYYTGPDGGKAQLLGGGNDDEEGVELEVNDGINQSFIITTKESSYLGKTSLQIFVERFDNGKSVAKIDTGLKTDDPNDDTVLQPLTQFKLTGGLQISQAQAGAIKAPFTKKEVKTVGSVVNAPATFSALKTYSAKAASGRR